jgi:hypothetical protein
VVARKPWCRVLYWFAMLIDAERIDREVDGLRALQTAELGAVGFHDPQRLWREHEARVAHLQHQPTMTDEQLIAYALAEGQKKAGVS